MPMAMGNRTSRRAECQLPCIAKRYQQNSRSSLPAGTKSCQRMICARLHSARPNREAELSRNLPGKRFGTCVDLLTAGGPVHGACPSEAAEQSMQSNSGRPYRRLQESGPSAEQQRGTLPAASSSRQSLKDSQTRTGARDISVWMQASEDEQNPEPPVLPAIME